MKIFQCLSEFRGKKSLVFYHPLKKIKGKKNELQKVIYLFFIY